MLRFRRPRGLPNRFCGYCGCAWHSSCIMVSIRSIPPRFCYQFSEPTASLHSRINFANLKTLTCRRRIDFLTCRSSACDAWSVFGYYPSPSRLSRGLTNSSPKLNINIRSNSRSSSLSTENNRQPAIRRVQISRNFAYACPGRLCSDSQSLGGPKFRGNSGETSGCQVRPSMWL